jgi:hypothetical protein
MPIKANIITLDANGKVVLTPLEEGTVYMPGWRWFECRGQLLLAERVDRMGNVMEPEVVNSEGLPTEIDQETGEAFMVLSPGPDKPGAEELHIPAVKHSFRVSSPDGLGLRWWYTAEIAGIQLLGSESWHQIDVDYMIHLEHLATQAELVLAERAEQERRRAAQEAAELEENRMIQLAVVSVTASDLIRFVKCWPHLKCRKPNVNRLEMERVVRRWARSKMLNTFKVVSAAEPFYLHWCDAILEHWRIPVEEEEMPTIPPQDVHLVADFPIAFDIPPAVEMERPIGPESYLGDLAPDNSNDMVFGPPVVVQSGGTEFLAPVPTAVISQVNDGLHHEKKLDIRFGELQLKLLSPRIQASLGLDQDSTVQVISVLRSHADVTPGLINFLGDGFNIDRLTRFIDMHRGVEEEEDASLESA